MSELRVLHVIESLGRAGAEQALVNVLPVLRAAGPVVDVAALWPPYALADALEARGVVVHRLDLTHRWNVIQGVGRLAALGRRGRYDVMHAHTFFSALYVALTRPVLRRPHRFVTFHNLGYESYPADTAWRKIRKRLDSVLMRWAIDTRLAVSPAVARHYEWHLRLGPIDVQYNGIPVDELVPSPGFAARRATVLERYGVCAEARVLLFCGRLVHEKGHRFFLEALEQLRREGLEPRALIVGDGPLRAQVAEEVERRKLGRQVTLHPSVPHSELVELLQAVDILVMASTHEGFPLAPAEAMALERAVVATRVGGLPDLLEDGVSGLLVPPGDPARLAEAISRVLGDDALRRRLGENGRVRIAQRFGSRAIAAELLERYRSAE